MSMTHHSCEDFQVSSPPLTLPNRQPNSTKEVYNVSHSAVAQDEESFACVPPSCKEKTIGWEAIPMILLEELFLMRNAEFVDDEVDLSKHETTQTTVFCRPAQRLQVLVMRKPEQASMLWRAILNHVRYDEFPLAPRSIIRRGEIGKVVKRNVEAHLAQRLF
jgi:hypothetical protein